MKKLKSSLTATLIVFILISAIGSFTAAQTADVSFVRGFLTNTTPRADGNIYAGDTVQIAIFFRNNSTETVILDYAGVHFSWMPTDSLYGFNLAGYDIQVESDRDYFFQQQINMKIPTTANGNYSYYVGIEGHTSSSMAVSLSSIPVEFIVIGTGATTSPTNTNSGSNNPGGLSDTVFYGAIIAIVVIVIVLLVIVLMLRKRKSSPKPTETATNQPTPIQPEEKPSGQDFSI